MRNMRCFGFMVITLAAASVTSRGAVLVDNFNTAASAANYTAVSTDATSSFATYAYDYSVMGIPSAPSSGDGSHLGLRLDANFSAPAQAEAITLHTVQAFTGDYTVKFDAWLNVNGPFPEGGSGSTNYLGAGVGGDGTTNDFVANTGINAWTAVNGENGSGVDYRLYKGSSLQGVATGQYAAGTAADARNGENAYYAALGLVNVSNLPVQGANNGGPAQQNGTSDVGSFGMAWHRVQLVVDADGGTGGAPSVKWIIDGLTIGTLDAGANGAFVSDGRVTLGYSDPTTNMSDNPPYSFALIDNLEVTSVPEPTTLGAVGAMVVAQLARRRRN